jgi:hypothetical protein
VVFAGCIISDFLVGDDIATEQFLRNKIIWQHSCGELPEIQSKRAFYAARNFTLQVF